jgi:hypothetical protein
MPRKRKTPSEESNTTSPPKKNKPREIALIPGWTPKTAQEHFPTERTRTMVELMTAYGATHEQIAAALNISPAGVPRHYREELSLGASRANMAVVGNLYRIATQKSATAPVVNAAIWWTKARMGWTEVRRTMADVRTLSANVRDLTDAELIEILERAGAGPSGQGTLPPPGE